MAFDDPKPKPTMAEAMRKKDLLGTTEFKNTHLFASLHGIQQVFKRFFKIKDLPFIHSNDVKTFQRNKFEPTYPYSYVSVTSMGITEGSVDPTRIRRHGIMQTVHQANSTLSNHYYFPITLQLEFHFLTNDFLKAITFMSEALIISQTKTLNFELKTGPVKGFVTIMAESKDIPLPRSDRESESEPEAFDIAINFTVYTWTGVSREIAKVNNNGDIELNMAISVDMENITDEESSIIRTGAVNEESKASL